MSFDRKPPVKAEAEGWDVEHVARWASMVGSEAVKQLRSLTVHLRIHVGDGSDQFYHMAPIIASWSQATGLTPQWPENEADRFCRRLRNESRPLEHARQTSDTARERGLIVDYFCAKPNPWTDWWLDDKPAAGYLCLQKG